MKINVINVQTAVQVVKDDEKVAQLAVAVRKILGKMMQS